MWLSNVLPQENPRAQLLMTQPGVGPITALAYVLTMGEVSRFKTRQAGGELSWPDPQRAQLEHGEANCFTAGNSA
jgi:hypothetical protein